MVNRMFLVTICGLVACTTEQSPRTAVPELPGSPFTSAQDAGSDARLFAGATAPSALPYARGGKRLRARHYVAEGAEKFRGLYDPQLGFACEFAPDVSGGGSHCVPSNLQTVIYVDAQCTEPALAIGLWGGAPQPGTWISALTTDPAVLCVGEPPPPRASYRVGERFFEGGVHSLGKPLPTVYAMRDGRCAPTGLPGALVPPDVHRLQPVDAALLVAGTVTTLDVGGGLSLQRVVAEDDTQVTIAVRGLGGAQCSLLVDGRCVPEPIFRVGDGLFVDGACRESAFVRSSAATCARVPLGVRVDANVAHVFELAQTMGGSVQTTDPVGCAALDADAPLLRAVDEVTDRFPAAAVVQTGTGALHLTRFAASNGATASAFVALDPGGEFLDAQGHPCYVEQAIDGSLRCLPTRSLIKEAEYWRDAACNERLFVPADPGVALSELKFVRRRPDATQAIEALFSLSPYAGPLYHIDQTQCVSAGAAPIPLLARDQELPLESLVRVESAEL